MDSKAKLSKRNKEGYYIVKPVNSIKEMLKAAKDEAGDWDAYQYRIPDDPENGIRHITYKEFYETTENLGAALTDMGLGNAHIACLGDNSYPWIVAYLTVLKSAGVFVPIDRELPADDMLRIVNDSDSTAIFCGRRFEQMILDNRDRLPAIKYVISLDAEENTDDMYSMTALIERGRSFDRTEYDSLKSDENGLKMLVYTSGTTGIAKGVMLSEHNLVSGVYYGLQVSQPLSKGLSVLPYNHTYESVCDILVSIHKHSTLCINDSLKAVVKNLQLFKPDYIYLGPAFLELFYSNIMRTLKKQGKDKLVFSMIEKSNKLRKVGIDMRKVPILVYPTLHYQNGGIKITADGQSAVKNLFVAGEAVGGIHGENRLMGNSLLDIIVFGRNAGVNAAKVAKETELAELTLDHIAKYDAEMAEAGIVTDKVSPILLPRYTHGNPKYEAK